MHLMTVKKKRGNFAGMPVSDRKNLESLSEGRVTNSESGSAAGLTRRELNQLPSQQDDSQEQQLLEKMLDVWVDNQSDMLSYPMRRAIQLARVILEEPPIILLEEGALILDPSDKEQGHLPFVFSRLRTSTLLVNMVDFQTVSWLQKYACMHEGVFTSSGSVEEL